MGPKMGDIIVKFDVHNWGDQLDDYQAKDMNNDLKKSYICQDVFERMWILSNGDVGLRCADDNGFPSWAMSSMMTRLNYISSCPVPARPWPQARRQDVLEHRSGL